MYYIGYMHDSVTKEIKTMLIQRKSILTGVVRTRDIPVNPEDMALWSGGFVSIQEAMPYLNDVDREFILTGITSKEWANAFSKELKQIVEDAL
jgi:hypothetical protein